MENVKGQRACHHAHIAAQHRLQIEDQTARTLENIKAILAAGGATLADVVKVSAHLSDLFRFDRYNKVYAGYFPDPKPARTTVSSQLKGILVEIDATTHGGEE